MDKKEHIQKQLEGYQSDTGCDLESQVCGLALLWSEVTGFYEVQEKMLRERQKILDRNFFDVSPYAVKQIKALTMIIKLLDYEGVGSDN